MTDKLHIDAVIAAANRMAELQDENETLRAAWTRMSTTISGLRDEHDQLLIGLANQLPDKTPRTATAIVAAVADMALKLDAHEDASTPAFDEIAKLCGCPEWEYPGQVVRDVARLVEQLRVAVAVRDDARAASARDLEARRERDLLQTDVAWLRSAWETEIEKNKELTKRKDDAYVERDRCVAGLAAFAIHIGFSAWLGKHVGDPWDHDWRNIVFIHLPVGQVSWHIHDSELPWFSFLPDASGSRDHSWDGHTTQEKYERLAKLRDWIERRDEPCLAHTFVGDACRDCGLVAPRYVDGVREVESEHDQYDRATGDLGRPVEVTDINFVRTAKALGKALEQAGMGPDDIIRLLKEQSSTTPCGCSEKYVELAPGVHAKYCPLAGLPLERA